MNLKQKQYLTKIIKEEVQTVLNENKEIPSKQDIIRFLNSGSDSKVWKENIAHEMRIIFSKFDSVDDIPKNKLYELVVLLWNLKYVNQNKTESIFKEADTDKTTDHDLKWFQTNLEDFIEKNKGSEYKPTIKIKGTESETKWISVPIKFLKDILELSKTKKNYFKKDK